MCVRLHICICIYVCVYVCVFVYTYVCRLIYVYMLVYSLCLCLCICAYLCVFIYVYMSVFVYLCILMCVYICVYVCVCVFMCVMMLDMFFHRGSMSEYLYLSLSAIPPVFQLVLYSISTPFLSFPPVENRPRWAASCSGAMIEQVVCTTFDYSCLNIRLRKKMHTLDRYF